MPENSFAEDVAFLRNHVDTVVLENDEGAAVAVVPQYQGRTMTSCSDAIVGRSYGYINYEAVAADHLDRQINLYGGEDRVWISPEGGQYSIFFEPQVEMSFANWRTPPPLDTEPFQLVTTTERFVALTQEASFTNWSNARFETRIDREVELLDRARVASLLQTDLDGVQLSAHESRNSLTNLGQQRWQAETGLISIWMLCMSKPSPQATLIVPFQTSPGENLTDTPDAEIVNADYFGKLGADRLQVDRGQGLIYFRGDGNHRSKLGLTFDRVCNRLGSWDPQRRVLSMVEFNLPKEAPHGFNNNLWEMQLNPYAGDVINCYNDGVNESGAQLATGGFYELETLSPALALGPNESYTHVHRTIRMEAKSADRQGLAELSRIASHIFGVSLEHISGQLQ